MNNEPVAYITKYDLERLPLYDCWVNGEKSKGSIPLYTLYTHPVELTDEEITQVFDECYPNNGDGDVVTLIDFARAILRKAQEK